MPIKLWAVFIMLIGFTVLPAYADIGCAVEDRSCLLAQLGKYADSIPEDNWRDQTYREMAKLLAADNNLDEALDLIDKVKNPDTRAMTIRGIGMAAADLNLPKERLAELFTKLRAAAEKIEHEPSYAIALTYIGMAQAYARDDEGAMATAASMSNAALRNKAYGETAEVQAERNDLQAVLKSLAAIDDPGYKDKELGIITKIFTNQNQPAPALAIAGQITNAYERSQALLFILSHKPETLAQADNNQIKAEPSP
ncbi:MAG: hypothetical protein HYS17_08795 [Micavibrio aeruginosavorus]|uniref:Uncharacterized protein n=1 Tax=Micavibrio aeruginosavorus TaxID=349221 RepID=A0A7T5UHH4_9BACT|nr:MAG: hypothetical protein HYS17_08795 [Micavibrio aeruginosavorus]